MFQNFLEDALDSILPKGYLNKGPAKVERATLTNFYEKWGPFFQINLDFALFKVPKETANIFHFTSGADNGQYGFRNPALWVQPGGNFHFCSAVNGHPNHCYNFYLKLNHKYHVNVNQVSEGGKFFYQIAVDGKLVHQVENKKALQFSNVNFFLSDPWYPALSHEFGKVENVIVNTIESCEKSIHFG